MATLSSITIPAESVNGTSRTQVVDNILLAIGDAAPLVDALEYIPAHPVPPAPPAPRVPEAEVAEAEEGPLEVIGEVEEAAALSEPMVIDLPPVILPRFEMTPLAHRTMAEIGDLSRELEREADKMSKDVREAKREILRQKSKILEREIDASRTKFQEQMQAAQAENEARRARQREARQRARREDKAKAPAVASIAPAVPVAPTPVVAATPRPAVHVRPRSELTNEEKRSLAAKERRAALVLGRGFHVPVEKQGAIVGEIRAKLNPSEVIRQILGGTAGDRDEVPFAIDSQGNLYTRNDGERATLDRLGVPQRIKNGQPLSDIPNWIVVSSRDEESGLRVGVARPVGENLIELRQTAARNFGYGLGLIAFALVGMVPLANHFTRDVQRVTRGAERIAQGDLQTRLPVKGNDEFGQLALAFNRMAEDLSEHQRRLVSEESARRDYQRKTVELEEARRFQLSMLPKEVPRHEHFDVAVFTQTATEVGGDYYDFHADASGALSVTIGDATGHGARAGTMVTVIKALFAGYDGDTAPAAFLSGAAEKIKRMDLGRMAMALALARFERRRVTIASAGMPPMLVYRAAENRVEEITLPATPLGTLGIEYEQRVVNIGEGDTILLMSDGFPELLDRTGQQLGYPQAAAEFAAAAASLADSAAIIDALSGASRRWHGDQPPNDDITFVVVRATA
jgi:serine phosphatase RsbU (regulator of sigma subunit)